LAQVFHGLDSKELKKNDLGLNQIEYAPLKSELPAKLIGKKFTLFEKIRIQFRSVLELQKKYVRISDKFLIIFLKLFQLGIRMVLLPLGHKKKK